MNAFSLRLRVVMVFSLLGAGVASAQPYAPPPPPPPAPPPAIERSGVLIGGGLGIGSMTFDSSYGDSETFDNGLVFQLRFGGMLSPRLALGVEYFGMSADLGDEVDSGTVTIHQRNFGAWVRFWVIPRLWLQGGIHSARAGAESDFDEEWDVKGVGVSAAAGFEILRSAKWSLDLGLRLSGSGYKVDNEELSSSTVGATLDFNFWF